ncbi:hypothetical protein GOBAR_AA37979 [Gossypium barbadense]|uniref:Uncharacterized protein n=1 Tax=Gossypium barbadense TaxID=3634 RepID=A0A2P5VV93_GOSBA|nr:hypothetical protein GOBAR_AA37979 [Gossypium barbadense]
MVEPVNLTRAWTLHTRAWEKRTKLNTVIRHDRVHPHVQGTRACTKSVCPKIYKNPALFIVQSIEEEAYEDIPDEVPPQHEDLPSQPPPPSRPVHAAASYADISKRLTRFKQQCFQ